MVSPKRYVTPCGLDPSSPPKALRAIVTEASQQDSTGDQTPYAT